MKVIRCIKLLYFLFLILNSEDSKRTASFLTARQGKLSEKTISLLQDPHPQEDSLNQCGKGWVQKERGWEDIPMTSPGPSNLNIPEHILLLCKCIQRNFNKYWDPICLWLKDDQQPYERSVRNTPTRARRPPQSWTDLFLRHWIFGRGLEEKKSIIGFSL